MKTKIVTDSTSDLPPQLAKELDITVVPAYLHFGDHTYRDRVDIDEDAFYTRLLNDPSHPTTEPPTPNDFASIYQKLSHEADNIISIHISSMLSATYSAALRGKELVEDVCPIEVIDSQLVTMGLGLLTIKAANLSKSNMSLPEVVEVIKQTIPEIRLLGLFDTLKYLAEGGRIGKAKALLGSVLNVKPILTMNNGEIEPARQVRSRSAGIANLIEFVKKAVDIRDLAIIHSTTPHEAENLADGLDPIFSKDKIILTRLGPVLGVHGGPGIMFVALRARA